MQDLNEKLICKLTSAELQKRRATVIRELKSLITAKEEMPNGYKYIFPGNDLALDKILDFIKSERLCCDFFLFNLAVEQDAATLVISGPQGSKEFLDHEVGF